MATRRQLSQNNRENEKLTRECEELTNRQQVSYAPIYFSGSGDIHVLFIVFMVNSSTNIKNRNNHISPQLTEHKKKGTSTYVIGNPGPGLRQAQKCGRIKPSWSCP